MRLRYLRNTYWQKFIQYEAPSKKRPGPVSIPIGLKCVGSFCNGMPREVTKVVWMFHKACGWKGNTPELISFPQCKPSLVYEKFE